MKKTEPLSRNHERSRVWVVKRSVILFALSTLTLWFSLKWILAFYGLAILGTWGLLLSYLNAFRLLDFGVNTGLLTSIAKRTGNEQKKFASELTVFAGWVVFGTSLVLLLGLIFCSWSEYLSAFLFRGDFQMIHGWNFLWIGLGALLFNVAQVFGSSLEGFNRADLKNVSTWLGQVVFLCALFLSHRYGTEIFHPLAAAYLSQGLMSFASALFFSTRFFKSSFSPVEPQKISRDELFKVGLGAQSINLASVCFDLSTRWAVQYFGGNVSLGIYELSQKILLQGRGLIGAGYQASLSFLSQVKVDFFNVEQKKFWKWLLFFSGSALFSIPFLSFVFFKQINWLWMQTIFGLGVGHFLNLASLPMYFFLLSRQKTGLLARIQFEVVGLNLILISLFGFMFSWPGVVMGSSIAMAWSGLRVYRVGVKGESI